MISYWESIVSIP